MRLVDLIARMPNLDADEEHLLTAAYNLAEEAHRPQKRKSGEPYFVHVAEVAAILAELGVDLATVMAGLLHDVVEDTDITLETIRHKFGGEVAHLVDGVTKLHSVPAQSGGNGQQELTEAEYLRKTIYAMTDDVRVILIKLADRLHNMRTLGSLSPHRQVAISQETLNLFAPLANRLGIWCFKAELEDLSFRYIEPANYRYITHQLEINERNIAPMRTQLIETLERAFEGHGLRADVFPIKQYIYTVYTQMHARRIPVEETFGVRGIRILLDGTLDCYRALGILHQCWRPVPERFIDYIAAPKDKFYQSLHTAVFYEDGVPIDVQIRTYDMDYRSDYGIVAYLRDKSEPHERKTELDRRLDYLKQLIEPAQVEETPERFVQSVIENIDSDRIYVMTPKGDMMDLPRGSTPIDFAYHVHTEVGHRCRGARVNGKLVPLDYKLNTNDRVEIYTANRGGPSLEWLDEHLDYVRTNRARNAIRSWFRKQRRERVISTGEKALDDALQQLGMTPGEHEHVRDTAEFATVNDMLEAIGKGAVSATQVITDELERREREPRYGSIQAFPTTGARGYDVKMARCCTPKPVDKIIGYVTREGKVSVHRADCRLVKERGNIADRMIPVEWGSRPEQSTLRVPVKFLTEDRPGMLANIGEVLATHNVNLTQGRITTDNGLATLHVTVDVDSYDTLSRVLTIIKSIEGVKEARRSTL